MATVPAAMVAWLRRLTAEPLENSTYSDATLVEAIDRYPLPDTAGVAPTDATWVGAWDIHPAAADIWEEKAAATAAAFDFAADGGDYKRSQVYGQMVQQARRFRAMRRSSTYVMVAEPPPAGAVGLKSWIGNLPEAESS
jgi:hypothetical protein